MSYFAKIEDNNLVSKVIVANQEFIDTLDGTWIETSENGPIKNFGNIGYTYDLVRNAFISPKPFPSWVLNESICIWESPVPHPNNEIWYTWDEGSLNWIPVL